MQEEYTNKGGDDGCQKKYQNLLNSPQKTKVTTLGVNVGHAESHPMICTF